MSTAIIGTGGIRLIPKDLAMALSETARKTHDELFSNHVSTLAVTDPELIEYFDNFAFDEVLRYGSLDTKTRLMVLLAALVSCQTLSEYLIILGAARNIGVIPIEVKEIVYQNVPLRGPGQGLRLHPCHQRRPLPLHPLRHRPADARTTDVRHTRRPRRLRSTSARPRRCQPQSRQRPRRAPRRYHAAAAVHRLPPHPERPRCHQ
jgi:alkylhydroperoxidase/carboxymuconolactone decarboxylase family protein YurZ